MHTTIGACAFHFRVRDGIGWFHAAIVTRERVEGREAGGLACSTRTRSRWLPRNKPMERVCRWRISWDVAKLLVRTSTCRRVQGHLRLYGQATRIISTG